MKVAHRITVGISDLKTLYQSINNNYSIDFSNYALSSLRNRIEDFIDRYRLTSIEELILKIETDKSFFQLFLKNILVDTTEMFRDPDFWVFLRIHIFSKFVNRNDYKFWIPDCNSGEELYTLQIITNQLNLQDKTYVFITSLCPLNIDRISDAHIDGKKMEISTANFERYQGSTSLNDYFIVKGNENILKPELIDNVEIVEHNLFLDDPPGIFDFIIFRNKMLYYNSTLKIESLKKLHSALKPGGFLALGIKESLDYPGWERDFSIVSESERIYKKSTK